MQNQTSVWLDVRRDRPDWIYLQGWGAMNPTAIKEAAKTGFPMNRLVGVWWSGGDEDARPGGRGCQGLYARSTSTRSAQNFPAIQDILKYVVDKGKSQVASKDKVGENFYDRGVLNSVLIAEAIRTAQKLTGKKLINGADMRRGFESAQHHRRALERAGPRRLCRADPSELRRPQWARRHLARRNGTGRSGSTVDFDRADQGQGSCR